MNRKIKFKVWDNWNKKFLDYGEVDIWDLVFTEPKLMEEIYTDGMANEWLEFLQYTGIKDKNGVEVYDNDIIQTDVNLKKWIVYEEDYAWYVKNIDNNEKYPLGVYKKLINCHGAKIEVIGNIYENKELLYKII